MALFGIGQDARSSEVLADKNCYGKRRREHELLCPCQPLGQSIGRNCSCLKAPELLDEAVAEWKQMVGDLGSIPAESSLGCLVVRPALSIGVTKCHRL